MGAHETRTFKSGNSVALRLPKALGIGPDERMVVERQGNVLTVRPVEDPAEAKRKLAELVERLRASGRVGEIDTERLEFPERPGV